MEEETVTITIKAKMDRQELEQTCYDMLEHWFNWASDDEVKTEVKVES